MGFTQASLLAQALRLLNEKPRFRPRDTRLSFNSYSVAAEIEEILKRQGYDPADPRFFPKS
jgi:hypothetical protein